MPVPVPVHRLSVRPAACMSVSVAVFHLSQHIQSVKRQVSRDGGQGTRRSVRYNTGLWDFVVRCCCCCCCYCISYVDMAARSSTSQRLFVVGFVGILFSPSLSLSLLLLVLLLVCVFCLFFSFFDLIENLENQVNSLGDSRQCICGWIV